MIKLVQHESQPSTDLQPAGPGTGLSAAPQGGALATPPSWAPPTRGGDSSDPDEKPFPWHRYFAALVRYRVLIAAIVILGTIIGFVATRLVIPQYEASTTLWITMDDKNSRSSEGPIGASNLLNSTAWIQLFQSRRVVQPVVQRWRLFLHTEYADRDAFHEFDITDNAKSATFILQVAPTGRHWTLTTKEGYTVGQGEPGDSIGTSMGMRWKPVAGVLRPGRKIKFTVFSLGQASSALVGRSTAVFPGNQNFLQVTLTGTNPNQTATILNDWVSQFITESQALKKSKDVSVSSTIQDQLNIAGARLSSAEAALRNFEEQNVTNGGGSGPSSGPAAAGASADPVASGYFGVEVQHENLVRDIAAVQRITEEIRAGQNSPEALLAVPSLMLGADNLRAAITERNDLEKKLRDLRATYTEEYKPVKDLEAQLKQLDTQMIPQIAQQAIVNMKASDSTARGQMETYATRMRQVPDRTIQELRLKREFELAQELYTGLQKRYQESNLAQETAVADVSILDKAEPPQQPTKNTAARTLLAAVFGSILFALGLAILLDMIDPRFRYPEQAVAMRLPILGTVPRIPTSRRRSANTEMAAQVVEAFRGIRQSIGRHFYGQNQVILTVTSPGPGDGKSLISSNLAMSFAESGRRVLLVDGDIRRGQLHSTFMLRQSAGLLDYLGGEATIDEVMQETDFQGLTFIGCGTRRHHGPEMLASSLMEQFVSVVRPQFDVIIIDSAPLGAGIDAFALGTVTGHIMMVLRVGVSDRKIAEHKLSDLDRYPVRQIGVVLNDLKAAGEYRQYSYLYGYALDTPEPPTAVPGAGSKRTVLTRRSNG